MITHQGLNSRAGPKIVKYWVFYKKFDLKQQSGVWKWAVFQARASKSTLNYEINEN